MSEWISFCLKAFGLILSAVTTVFTVLLWGSLPEDTWASLLMGIAGFALEGSKFLLLLLALLFLKRKQFLASIVGGTLATLLFVVSIGASVGFLEKSEQQQQRSSGAWNNTQNSIAQIDAEIEMLLDASRRDIENGYRDRGLRTRTEISSLREQRKTLLETPENSPVETSFGGLASMLGMDDDSVRLYAWLLLAVLIDGVAAACWAFLVLLNEAETVSEIPETPEKMVARSSPELEQKPVIQKQPEVLPEEIEFPEAIKTETVIPVYNERNLEMFHNDNGFIGESVSENTSQKVYSCSAASNPSVIIEKQDGLFDLVKQKIDDGQEGYFPGMSLNQLMRLESIGYQKARRVMDRIETEYGETLST